MLRNYKLCTNFAEIFLNKVKGIITFTMTTSTKHLVSQAEFSLGQGCQKIYKQLIKSGYKKS